MPSWLQDVLALAVYAAAVAAALLQLRRIAGTPEGGASCGSCDHAPRTIPAPPQVPSTARRARGLVVLGSRGEAGR